MNYYQIIVFGAIVVSLFLIRERCWRCRRNRFTRDYEEKLARLRTYYNERDWSHSQRIKSLEDTLAKGCRHLDKDVHRNHVDIVGVYNDNRVIVKSFTYMPHDHDDYEFALRQADELIENIEKM